MNISNEAAYLYVLSKEIESLNRKIKRLSKKADKHKERHQQASEEKKEKHRRRYGKVIEKLKDLLKEHNRILTSLRRHQIAFAGGNSVVFFEKVF